MKMVYIMPKRFLIQPSDIESVTNLMEYIDTLKPDVRYDVTIKTYRKNRSAEQNSYLRGVVYKKISEYTSYTDDEVHQLCAEEFLSYEKNGKKFVKSTTRLDTAEMENYLSRVRMWASTNLSLYIGLPNETKWSEVK